MSAVNGATVARAAESTADRPVSDLVAAIDNHACSVAALGAAVTKLANAIANASASGGVSASTSLSVAAPEKAPRARKPPKLPRLTGEDYVLRVVRAMPGATSRQLVAMAKARVMLAVEESTPSENAIASALYALSKRGDLRVEGSRGSQSYFAAVTP